MESLCYYDIRDVMRDAPDECRRETPRLTDKLDGRYELFGLRLTPRTYRRARLKPIFFLSKPKHNNVNLLEKNHHVTSFPCN
jgi:hypothetical protein